MRVFRITKEKHADTLGASGGEGRWNRLGEFVLYTAESNALCTLECLAHRSFITPSAKYKLMNIDIPNIDLYTQIIKPETLMTKFDELNGDPQSWKKTTSYEYLQSIGSQWYNAKVSLVLKVPSAIISNEYNYIINTRHKDFNIVTLSHNEDFTFDERLF